MRVLVYEPDHNGHHFAYLRLMLPALLDLGAEVTLYTTGEAMSSDPYRSLIAPLVGRICVEPAVDAISGAGYRAAAAHAKELLLGIARVRPDHVIVPYGDGISQALAARRLRGLPTIPRGVSSEALFLRGGFAYPASGLRRRVFLRASWELARRAPYSHFHHLDPLVYDRIVAHDARASRRWSLMPDPVERPEPLSLEGARRRLGLPSEGRLIGCAGAIDTRKGCDLLVRAFIRSRLGATDRLALVGPHAPGVNAILQGEARDAVSAGRIVSLDRFFNPEELAVSLVAMNVVCTPYPGHIGSASIVIRAAAADRPVLGSDFGWVARTVSQFQLGWKCHVEDLDGFARAIESSLERAPGHRSGEAAKRFVKFHSPENFAACWQVRLREKMGLGAAPSARPWEWVKQAVTPEERGH